MDTFFHVHRWLVCCNVENIVGFPPYNASRPSNCLCEVTRIVGFSYMQIISLTSAIV